MGRKGGPLLNLADFIQTNSAAIVEEWEHFARSSSPAASALSGLLLRDDIEAILVAITHDMRQPQSRAEQIEKSKGRGDEGPLDKAGQEHAGQRSQLGFGLDETMVEIRALRASVVRLWQERFPERAEGDLGELIRFNEAIDQVLIQSMSAYTRRMERYREQFLAVLEHDLRTPIGAILMSASLMERASDLGARHTHGATVIVESAERMSRLMNDLLDLTRARLGAGLPLARSPMDLEVVCRQVLAELEAFHPDRLLRFTASGGLHGEWDGARLAQVVSNLVANALQHGSGAAVAVSAEARGDQITLTVHNEGPAIPPEDMGKIFEPLIRSRSEEQPPEAHSLGLGLFIVREIVTAHGGEVRVSSSAEQGTTFTVCLPRRPQVAGERCPTAGSPKGER